LGLGRKVLQPTGRERYGIVFPLPVPVCLDMTNAGTAEEKNFPDVVVKEKVKR